MFDVGLLIKLFYFFFWKNSNNSRIAVTVIVRSTVVERQLGDGHENWPLKKKEC